MEQPKKLFEVQVEAVFYAVADDEAGAEQAILDAISSGDVTFDEPGDLIAGQVTSFKGFDREWENARPFGDGGRETCGDLIRAWEEYERSRPRSAAELEAAGQQTLGI
jgi:hypothetical protein